MDAQYRAAIEAIAGVGMEKERGDGKASESVVVRDGYERACVTRGEAPGSLVQMMMKKKNARDDEEEEEERERARERATETAAEKNRVIMRRMKMESVAGRRSAVLGAHFAQQKGEAEAEGGRGGREALQVQVKGEVEVEATEVKDMSGPMQSAKQNAGGLTMNANAIPPPLRSPSYGHFTPPLSIQELFYPQSRCFGCGPANRFGLRIRSMPPPQPGGAVTAYIAACPVYHSNGMGMTNGGVLASLIDCHTGAAIAWRGWEKKMSSIGIGVGCGDCKEGSHGCTNGPFLTSSLNIKYRRPTPYNLDALIVAEVVHMTEWVAVVKCKVISGGEVTVLAEAKWRRPNKTQWGRTKEKLASIQNNVHDFETHLNF